MTKSSRRFFSCFSGDDRQSSALHPAREEAPDLRGQDHQSPLPRSTSDGVSSSPPTQAELRSHEVPAIGDALHPAREEAPDLRGQDPQSPLPRSTSDGVSSSPPTQAELRSHEVPAIGDPSSRISTVPELTKKIEDHVAVDTENESIDLEGIIQDISTLFNIIQTNSDHEKPSTGHYWPRSPIFFSTLKDILSETADGALATKEDIISSSEGMKVVNDLLKGLGQAHWAAAGLLVVANILERFQMVAANRDECLLLLGEMSTLAHHVKDLKKRTGFRKGMEASIKKATEMIVEGALMCCTQSNSSFFSRFFKTSVNKEKLATFQQKLQIMYKCMDHEMLICILDAVECANVRPPVKERERSYPEYAVGIEEALEEVIELLEWESKKEAVAVMVHGFGGMGKTTLADAVFARLYIEGCKYSMVRLFEDIKSTDIIDLQKRILKDLMLGSSEEQGTSVLQKIHTFEDGRREIGRMLENEVAFIYIDNVFEQRALEMLLPRDIKARRCRLLITARDRGVRNGCSVDNESFKSYDMKYLPDTEAMNLFNQGLHFQKKDDKELLSFDQLQQVVELCGGIPLLLYLLARYIRYGEDGQQEAFRLLMEDKEKWNLQIEGLDLYLFNYDSLPERVKEPFLDICSFFNGSDWNKVRNVVGDSDLNVLEKRGLVKKDKNMKVTVHDVILTIGSRKSKGTRFTSKNKYEIEKFLKKDLHGIKGISLNLCGDKLSHASNPFEDLEILIPARKLDSMSDSLRILALGSFGKVEGTCENFFEKLVYFEGRLPYLPFDVSQSKELRYFNCTPRNLNFLKEISANLKHMELDGRMLESEDVFGIFSNDLQQHKDLRTLKLSYFNGLKKLPDELGNSLKCLQELDLSCCHSIEELPGSVSELQSLRKLRLRECYFLKSLPENLGSLSSLQTLDLSWCLFIEKVPASISNLQSLRDLSMKGCSALKELPEDLGSLSSLQKLDLSVCESIEKVPASISNLQSLRDLSMNGCSTLKELPEDLGSLSSLQSLDLSDCISVEKIPRSFSKLQSLRELSMVSCSLLKMLPKMLPEDFGYLISLQKLNLSYCCYIEELPKSISMLPSLKQLKLAGCSSLKSLPEDLGSLSSLQSLDLSDCNSIEELPGSFSKLPPLKKLKMGGCSNLKRLPKDFISLTQSTSLELDDWPSLDPPSMQVLRECTQRA